MKTTKDLDKEHCAKLSKALAHKRIESIGYTRRQGCPVVRVTLRRSIRTPCYAEIKDLVYGLLSEPVTIEIDGTKCLNLWGTPC